VHYQKEVKKYYPEEI
jgi:heat shock 70kDa protein 1/2/6/8